MTYYFDMDGVIANFHKEPYKYSNAINREWIANLEPFQHNIDTIKRLISEGHKVYILSKAASNTAKQGKYDWLNRYLPQVHKDNIIIIVGNGKKCDYIRENGVLVDDDIKNCRQWAKAGYEYYLVENKGDIVRL